MCIHQKHQIKSNFVVIFDIYLVRFCPVSFFTRSLAKEYPFNRLNCTASKPF